MVDKDLVREFFQKRFGRSPESDPGYYQEWVDRFASGHPEVWMDSKSKEIYKSLL